MSDQNTFFSKYVLLHTHIEKCGGSTLLTQLTSLLGESHVYDLRNLSPAQFKAPIHQNTEFQSKKNSIQLLSGHIHYGKTWAKLFPNQKLGRRWIAPIFPSYGCKQALYIASVRHPIERLISLFRYIRKMPHHNLYNNYIQENDFDGFIQNLINSNCIKVSNEMCAQITGHSNSTQAFKEARNAFEHHYLAITPHNKTHELVNFLSEILEQPMIQPSIVNQSSTEEKATPNKHTIALLEEKCHDDILLYEHVFTHYEEKLMRAKDYLSKIYKKSHIKK